MKITLLTVGKIKEKYLRDAIAEYSKRLSKYCKLEIIEVADEKTPDHASEVVEKSIRDKEGERLMRYIRDDDYVITLEIGGKMLDSVAFSRQLGNLGIQGQSHICFAHVIAHSNHIMIYIDPLLLDWNNRVIAIARTKQEIEYDLHLFFVELFGNSIHSLS